MSDALDSTNRALDQIGANATTAGLTGWRQRIVETPPLEAVLRAEIAAEIESFADDHSDVSDAYRHAALIAKGTPGP